MPDTTPRKSVANQAPAAETAGKAPTKSAAAVPKPAAKRAVASSRRSSPRTAAAGESRAAVPPQEQRAGVGAPEPERSPPEATAAPAPRAAPRPRVPAWSPRDVPPPREGKPADPRLAAALAARERWHGRSGRPALKSGTQAVAFARERLLVHPTDATPLPNLLDPIVGKACVGSERETGPAATTLATWRKETERSHDLLEMRLCFERPTLVQADLWPALWTVVAPREEEARNGILPLPPAAEEALEILDRRGSMPVKRLRSQLDLSPEEMGHLRGLLETKLLVLARTEEDEDEGPLTVLEPFGRWASRVATHRRLEVHQAYTLLFAAAVRSAVVLWPEEITALFPWTPAERDTAVAACLQAGAVVTYDEGDSVAYVASPVPR